MAYYIKTRLDITDGDSLPVLKPDHVSLGKCVTSQEFIRKYATIQNIDVVSMLRDGCTFKGFQKIKVESSEEEGFVNMHHVLILETLDSEVHKKVCVRRKNNVMVDLNKIKNGNNVVTDTKSVVIVSYVQGCFHFFYFGNLKTKMYKMNSTEGSFELFLTMDILYCIFQDYVEVINFKYNKPFCKKINFSENPSCLSLSNGLLVLCRPSVEEPGYNQILFGDDLEKDSVLFQISVNQDIISDLQASKTLIATICECSLWLSADEKKFTIYLFTKHRELNFCKTFELSCIYPNAMTFSFERFCFCESTSQAFLLYIRDDQTSKNSFIMVVDLLKMHILSILEMELTINRKPKLFMYPSVDGSKLFVQETFDNRVIFYQVFSLLPGGLSLKNITKQFIWKKFCEDDIHDSSLPQTLIDELSVGF